MKQIGSRIRSVRLAQRRTLADVAKASKLTLSMLSKIETNSANPAMATLYRIAKALKTPPFFFLQDSENVQTAFQKAPSWDDFPLSQFGQKLCPLSSARTEKMFQPVLYMIDKSVHKRKSFTHSGEEFIYLLEGSMEYQVGKSIYTLHKGDSLYFNAEEKHSPRPLTDKVHYLAIFTEKSIP